MKLFASKTSCRTWCCSSQEEHVLKLSFLRRMLYARLLLLARGACIETPYPRGNFYPPWLLLARGACIETSQVGSPGSMRNCCSSQEEHVLKQFHLPVRPVRTGCSSQEEHVLKRHHRTRPRIALGCSSQEEHVLKLIISCLELFTAPVAPRKRSMY